MRSVHHGGRTAAAVLSLTCLLTAGGVVASATAAQGSLGSPRAARPAAAPKGGAVSAGWLARQFESNGDLPETEGAAGVTYLPLALVALASAQVGSHQINEGIRYLEHNFASFVVVHESASKSVPDPGRLAEVILAAVAAKADPRDFGGETATDNLVARLLATQVKSGADTGLFGSPAAPTYSTAYTQGLVLTALAAAGQVNKAGAAWLVGQQCADGGWQTYRSRTKACPAPDPSTYTGPDTNDTALAIEGLAASDVSPAVSPVAFLRAAQYPSGGFAYFGGHSTAQSPDPDSTALVTQALVALRALSAVTRDSRGAESGLAAFHLGCGSPTSERGAYRYPGVAGANLYATIQAIPAVLRQPYPVAAGSASASLPVMSCT